MAEFFSFLIFWLGAMAAVGLLLILTPKLYEKIKKTQKNDKKEQKNDLKDRP